MNTKRQILKQDDLGTLLFSPRYAGKLGIYKLRREICMCDLERKLLRLTIDAIHPKTIKSNSYVLLTGRVFCWQQCRWKWSISGQPINDGTSVLTYVEVLNGEQLGFIQRHQLKLL